MRMLITNISIPISLQSFAFSSSCLFSSFLFLLGRSSPSNSRTPAPIFSPHRYNRCTVTAHRVNSCRRRHILSPFCITSVYASARLWDPLKFSMAPIYMCTKCRRPYKTKYTLRRHERFECGLPALYKCEQCDYRAKHKHSVKQHVESVHEKRKLSYTWRSIL